MFPKIYLVLFLTLFAFLLTTKAQKRFVNFSAADTSLNKKKLYSIIATKSIAFGGALVVLNEVWYKDFPRSGFHTFNDGKEWLQVDKAGHAFSAYFLSRWSSRLYLWSGLNNKKASLAGAASAMIMMSSIELFDAFSEAWGFSVWDFAANSFGTGLFLSQEFLWQEQRIMLKTSYFPKNYKSGEIKKRTDQLYGTSFLEQSLKDYNGQTTWVSLNIASFIQKENRFPKWLNVSFGYGAEGILGGFENKWCKNESEKFLDCPEDLRIDRTDIDRYRQYYLSLDVDFTKIKVRKKGWQTVLGMLNIVKMPFPALEFNSKNKIRLSPLR